MGNEILSTTGSISTIGPWVISGLALIQVWVIALWRKIRKPVVEIHPSGAIEIGYGPAGPSIGILGTLRTLHKDVFVRNIQLSVIKKRIGLLIFSIGASSVQALFQQHLLMLPILKLLQVSYLPKIILLNSIPFSLMKVLLRRLVQKSLEFQGNGMSLKI